MKRVCALFGIIALSGFGCLSGTDVKLEKVDRADLARTIDVLQSPSNGLSAVTLNYLNSRLLLPMFYDDPARLIRELDAQFREDLLPERLEILSDIALNAGRDCRVREEALPFYFSTVEYAGIYIGYYLKSLSGVEAASSPSPFLMLRRYNAAVLEIFDGIFPKEGFPCPEGVFTTVCGREIRFTPEKRDLPFNLELIKKFIPCAEYRVKNLSHFSYHFGIGVPMIAVCGKQQIPLRGVRSMGNAAWPLTVLMRLRQDPDRPGAFLANLRFTSPEQVESYTFGESRIPVEYDFTTPLAFVLSQPDRIGLIEYMINPDADKKLQGLYLLDVYEPHKIPIIFVHGLMSSPKTWADMVNSLKNDPVIRKHYQFWFYTYSSGNPILLSARDFRNTLKNCAREAARQNGEEAFNKMVLVGHSMGGLLSKTAVTKSYNLLLPALTDVPADKLYPTLSDTERSQLNNIVVFEPLPFVRRVVFAATPHRGSEMAKGQIAYWGAAFITLPAETVAFAREVTRKLANPDNPLNIGTGIDNLSPDNPGLKILSTLPFKEGLPYHSIIGQSSDGPVLTGSDGIVPYWSSHLEGAESEVVVLSDHSVHTRALAIQELRRILLKHLEENGVKVEKRGIEVP